MSTWAVVVVAALSLVGCGSSAASPQSLAAARGHQQHNAAHPARGSNRDAAEREALRLLSLVTVPANASPLTAAPAALTGPGMGTPSFSSLVDRSRSWSVPMSFDDMIAWVRGHPPRGNPPSTGSAKGGGADGEYAALGYQGGKSSAWQSAELDLAVATGVDASHSYLRADGVVVWLDPRPGRDTATGRRVHFNVADGCPGTDGGVPDVSNSDPGLDRQLLPAEMPLSALACQYGGLNDRPFRLTHHWSLNRQQASAAARMLRALPLSHPEGGVTSCPAADDSTGYLAFGYANGQSIDVKVDLTGCATVSNGHIVLAAGGAPAMFRASR